ncbi:MAG: ATP synthase F1 subunit delta [Bacteroidales bacterium]|nr:ATP synthase F1 subunit delta [Bacteroidales bacterium]
MNISKVSIRYAKALLATTIENNSTDEVFSNLKLLENVIHEDKEFIKMIASPHIPISKKKEIIYKVFNPIFNQITINFLIKLIENKRETILLNIIYNFYKLYNDHKNIVEVTLIIPYNISTKTLEEIQNTLEKKLNKKVNIKTKIDEKIIGGFIIQIEDKEYNASILNQLNKIKEKINI